MPEALFLKHATIKANAPLKNGLGRFIPQLARITVKFCKESGSSQGVREFIERDIVEFAKKNPASVVYLKPRRHRTPVIVAEYLNGEKLWQPIESMKYEEVQQWMDYYQNHSGKNYVVQTKYEYTENPSIQGMWYPFVNADPEIAAAKFPMEKFSQPHHMPKSASEYLKEMYQVQKNQSELPPSENEELAKTKQ